MELWSLSDPIAKAWTSEAVSSEEALEGGRGERTAGGPVIVWSEWDVTCQDGRSTSYASSTRGPRGLKLVVDCVGQVWSICGVY